MLAREWADKIMKEIKDNPSIDALELRARGHEINRAVDVCEILKRELDLSKSAIRTGTRILVSRSGVSINVSEINIELQKK